MIQLGIAAGMLRTLAHITPVLKLDPSICAFQTLGSFTPPARDGNQGNRLFAEEYADVALLNAYGMPNLGFESLGEYLYDLAERENNRGGEIRLNIAGFSVDDYVNGARECCRYRFVKELELNLGCPNVRTDGAQEGIISFNPDRVAEIIDAVYGAVRDTGPRIAVKLSPYSNPADLTKVAEVIAERADKVTRVVTSNTYPNASGYDEAGRLLIDVNDGYGGMSGPAMKFIAIGQVRQFRKILPGSIEIDGVGGVSSGRDMRDLELAGASRVQVGSAFFRTMNPGVLQRIATEYAELSPEKA